MAVELQKITSSAVDNRLLASLPFSEFEHLRPHLQRVRLVRDQVLVEEGQAASHVFFVEHGIVSLLASCGSAKRGVQVAMIGAEGMVGGLGLLDNRSAAYAGAVVIVPGSALRMSVARLRQCLEERTAVRDVMLRCVQSLARQAMDMAACSASGTVLQRCINWLLMAHDRTEGDEISITHEGLSDLLGVRRSGITVATAALQESRLIRTSRGRIRILDRAGLIQLATGASRNLGTDRWRPGLANVPASSQYWSGLLGGTLQPDRIAQSSEAAKRSA